MLHTWPQTLIDHFHLHCLVPAGAWSFDRVAYLAVRQLGMDGTTVGMRMGVGQSARNPNGFYEIGVRHALRDKTIIITQRIDDIPFDLRQYSVIEYSWKTKNGKDDFQKKLHRVLTAIEKDTDGKITSSPIREYLSLNETS